MTRTRTLGTVACAAVLALSVVGCGSSDDKDKGSDSKALSAADFKEQANKLCADSNKDSESYGADISETSSDADVTAAIDKVVERNNKLADDIADLKAPEDMADDVASMLKDVRAGLTEMDKLSSVADMMKYDDTTGPIADANTKSTALGLDECAK